MVHIFCYNKNKQTKKKKKTMLQYALKRIRTYVIEANPGEDCWQNG